MFGFSSQQQRFSRGQNWNKKNRKWTAQITRDGKFREEHHLSSFEVEDDAARAFDAEALEKDGHQVMLNFPSEEHHRNHQALLSLRSEEGQQQHRPRALTTLSPDSIGSDVERKVKNRLQK